MFLSSLTTRLENVIFTHRAWVIGIFVLLTAYMALFPAANTHIDAGFSKHLPLKHEYMQTFTQYREEFGGANRILIALMAKQGDIFTPAFFATLKAATDDVFFLPGVDRTQVRSLFTPNVRFTEVVEDGIAGGNIIPADFQPTLSGLAQVRKNILKSSIVGRLVANDFSGAIISAQLLEFDPNTGAPLDYINVADLLEQNIRDKYANAQVDVAINIHIIGFAKAMGDISEGATRVILFFIIAFLITALLVFFYSQSLKLTAIPLLCSLIAVIWQFGLLNLLGFGIDPMSILVPFLIFAIGISHGVQMVSAMRIEVANGKPSLEAARASFRRLLLPGGIALLSDTIGFITLLFIEIDIIQEMAITASLGVAAIILTNLILLPLLLSYVNFNANYQQKLTRRAERLAPLWNTLARAAQPKTALIILVLAGVLLGIGIWKGTDIKIGDLHRGVPELHIDSRYNVDTQAISEQFSIGVDLISVIAETKSEGCIDYDIMTTIDRFAWHMQNIPGVQSVIALPGMAKIINAGWNEGSLKWRVLPRNQSTLVQAISYIPTSSGLLNRDCSVMPVHIFTTDHKATTIARIVAAVKEYRQQAQANPISTQPVTFKLATGNVGVMAATNEAVQTAQFPMLLYIFSAIIALCLLTFRSIRATLCIVLPLGLVSLLAYALMSLFQIGLKVNTLPVVALGVGIGVDYGIYIYSCFQQLLKQGKSVEDAYRETLSITGSGVLFTGITLAIGVATWIFSPLKFQVDMGILLTFMFLVNMLAAIILLPALACWLLRSKSNHIPT